MTCPSCGREIAAGATFCGACGYTFSAQPGYSPSSPAGSAPNISGAGGSYRYGSAAPIVVDKKYKALRIIATIYKVLAFIEAGFTLIIALVSFVSGIAMSNSRDALGFGAASELGAFAGVVYAFIILVYGAIVFIALYGFSEFIYVFLDIEQNTRLTNEMLSRR